MLSFILRKISSLLSNWLMLFFIVWLLTDYRASKLVRFTIERPKGHFIGIFQFVANWNTTGQGWNFHLGIPKFLINKKIGVLLQFVVLKASTTLRFWPSFARLTSESISKIGWAYPIHWWKSIPPRTWYNPLNCWVFSIDITSPLLIFSRTNNERVAGRVGANALCRYPKCCDKFCSVSSDRNWLNCSRIFPHPECLVSTGA